MAPRSISAGDGPSSPPPASAGASSTTRCGPIVASAFIPLIHCTLTVLAMSLSSLDASDFLAHDSRVPIAGPGRGDDATASNERDSVPSAPRHGRGLRAPFEVPRFLLERWLVAVLEQALERIAP